MENNVMGFYIFYMVSANYITKGIIHRPLIVFWRGFWENKFSGLSILHGIRANNTIKGTIHSRRFRHGPLIDLIGFMYSTWYQSK